MKLFNMFILLSIICFYISACGTQPRSTTMCYDEDQMKYIQCPEGYYPGDNIPKNRN